MSRPNKIRGAFERWYTELPKFGGFPAKGTISGALVVLDNLRKEFVLDINSHTAQGGSQIRGASGTRVKRILAEHGEPRAFVSEGGRTNRGLRGQISSLLTTLDKSGLGSVSAEQRDEVLRDLQGFLVLQVRQFFGRERLKLTYDPSKTAIQLVEDLLMAAQRDGKEGPVAQYLVGAKLQVRFPSE